MPTYEYQCHKCKKRSEVFQPITAKPLITCPRKGCGGKLTRLLGSGSGFLFKGSGFYITDYRSKGYQEAKKKDQPAPANTKGARPASSKDSSGKGSSGGSCASSGGSCKNGSCA
ncbi:MAG: zinc ribbon domain-containing protein [Candidatus Omnitrophica bacterium]|nr:zinc ribbon domain-containing protein [Candidatus Omnitrophota bacterium]